MDTEETLEIQKAYLDGRPQTDQGPYYHEAWWESYKGSVKGKLGGVIIGAIVGAIVGAVCVGALAFTSVALTGGIVAATIGGFAAAGLLYGAHEFSEVGKITGAVAAMGEKNEERIKTFESGKFAELKQEINELKAIISGKAAAAPSPAAKALPISDSDYRTTHGLDYRTQHCDDHCPPEGRQLVFWKVAGIGLAVGLAAGALLAFGGVSGEMLGLLGKAGEHISKAGLYTASMTATGLFGASFGINRDMFRQIFDKTDLWFKGITGGGKARAPELAQTVTIVQAPAIPEPSPILTMVENYNEESRSNTDWAGRIRTGQEALLRIDPSIAKRN